MRLLLATRNEHKRREFARLMPGWEIDLLPDDVELPPEDGETFADNALGKARAAAAATGKTAIADDSGVQAAALDGRPGVRSARYAGEHATDQENLAKLLAEAPAGSALRYVCALAFVDPRRGLQRVFDGSCDGTLAATPAGGRGFGYDPAFIPAQQPSAPPRSALHRGASGDDRAAAAAPLRTMAQLTDAEKDEISHRAIAVRALIEWLAVEA